MDGQKEAEILREMKGGRKGKGRQGVGEGRKKEEGGRNKEGEGWREKERGGGGGVEGSEGRGGTEDWTGLS